MKKIDPVVRKETAFMAAWTLIFSAILQAVFLVIGKWNYTVLLGNLLSAAAVILSGILQVNTLLFTAGVVYLIGELYIVRHRNPEASP